MSVTRLAKIFSAALIGGGIAASTAMAASEVRIGVVNDYAGWNPYADSTAQMYMTWCQTYGCLGTFDTNAGKYKGILAERWEVSKTNSNVWTFYLKKGIKRHVDGKELTAEDVAHSIWRNKNDKRSAQKQNTRPVKSWKVIDKYTIQFTTKKPTAPLLSFIFDRLIITGKDLYEKYGTKVDRKAPWGYGPYMVKDIVVGQRYGQVTDQIIDYALGRYGSEGADEMDQNIKDRVLSLPRARELAARQDKEPTLKEMRAKFGGKGVSDEELILRWIAGRDEVETMRAAGPDRQYRIGGKKLVGMVRDLSGHKELNSVSIQKPGFSMTLGRQG